MNVDDKISISSTVQLEYSKNTYCADCSVVQRICTCTDGTNDIHGDNVIT